MRTTVDLDAAATAAIEQLRSEHDMGLSQAVNELIRRGLLPRPASSPFRQRTRPLGVKVDISNVAATLEDLEGPEAR